MVLQANEAETSLLQTLWVPLSVWNESLGQVGKASVGDRETNTGDCVESKCNVIK